MAAITFPELPGWTFAVDERSAGVYEVEASNRDGRSVRLVGYDPDELLLQAQADARDSDRLLAEKSTDPEAPS